MKVKNSNFAVGKGGWKQMKCSKKIFFFFFFYLLHGERRSVPPLFASHEVVVVQIRLVTVTAVWNEIREIEHEFRERERNRAEIYGNRTREHSKFRLCVIYATKGITFLCLPHMWKILYSFVALLSRYFVCIFSYNKVCIRK